MLSQIIITSYAANATALPKSALITLSAIIVLNDLKCSFVTTCCRCFVYPVKTKRPHVKYWVRLDSNQLNLTITDLQSALTLQLQRSPM